MWTALSQKHVSDLHYCGSKFFNKYKKGMKKKVASSKYLYKKERHVFKYARLFDFCYLEYAICAYVIEYAMCT